MSYYVVRSMPNAEPKSYKMTTSCDEPRLAIHGSYIPLTTSGDDGLWMNVGTTPYRVMEYKGTSGVNSSIVSEYSGVSSRESVYSTTSTDSSGMSNVTNLPEWARTTVSTTSDLIQKTLYQSQTSRVYRIVNYDWTRTEDSYRIYTSSVVFSAYNSAMTTSTLQGVSTGLNQTITWDPLVSNTIYSAFRASHYETSSTYGYVTESYSDGRTYTHYNTYGSQTWSRTRTSSLAVYSAEDGGIAKVSRIIDYGTDESEIIYNSYSNILVSESYSISNYVTYTMYTSGYAGYRTRQSTYVTSSTDQGAMSNITSDSYVTYYDVITNTFLTTNSKSIGLSNVSTAIVTSTTRTDDFTATSVTAIDQGVYTGTDYTVIYSATSDNMYKGTTTFASGGSSYGYTNVKSTQYVTANCSRAMFYNSQENANTLYDPVANTLATVWGSNNTKQYTSSREEMNGGIAVTYTESSYTVSSTSNRIEGNVQYLNFGELNTISYYNSTTAYLGESKTATYESALTTSVWISAAMTKSTTTERTGVVTTNRSYGTATSTVYSGKSSSSTTAEATTTYTYYTSSVNSSGMSSTTALTTVSTSNTIYFTRESVSGYGTRTGLNYETGSVMGIFRTANRTSYAGATTLWYTQVESDATIFHNPPYSSQINTSATKTAIVLSISSYDLITNLTSTKKTQSDGLTSSSVVDSTSYRISTNRYNYQFVNDGVNNLCTFDTNNCQFTFVGTSINREYSLFVTTIGTSIASTTNTLTYTETTATLTRASTSDTVYETRSSTSGYSGVVSSTKKQDYTASYTYYTSSVNSSGMSSTTALTQRYTSDTKYLTSQKITDTIYETASTSVSTVYISSTQKLTSLRGGAWITCTTQIRYTILYTSVEGTSTQHWADGTDVTITDILYTSRSNSNEITISSPDIQYSTNTYSVTSYTGARFGVTSPHDAYLTWNTSRLYSIIEDPPVYVTNVTTNTVYKTTADTYDTEYLTGIQTTGYSGVVSSTTNRYTTSSTYYSGVISRASYYQTTSELPGNMSSTTALTRVSTSDAEYFTEAQTTDVIYHTKSSSVTTYSERVHQSNSMRISGNTRINVTESFATNVYHAVELVGSMTQTGVEIYQGAVAEYNVHASSYMYTLMAPDIYGEITESTGNRQVDPSEYIHFIGPANGDEYAYGYRTYNMGNQQHTQAVSRWLEINNKITTGTEYKTQIVTTDAVYYTCSSTSAYQGSSSRSSTYLTTSSDHGSMSSITSVTTSTNVSPQVTTWV